MTPSDIDDSLLTPQFISQEEEVLFAEAVLGDAAVTFLNSELGQLLRGFASQAREKAKEALTKVDPDHAAKIRELQMRAAVADQFVKFVAEAVQQGEIAHNALINMRKEA